MNQATKSADSEIAENNLPSQSLARMIVAKRGQMRQTQVKRKPRSLKGAV